MKIVSIAKSTGGLSSIFPDGTTIETVPHDFHSALDHALRILSWQENLSGDEMPPVWMWPLDWEISNHFEIVESRRKAKYNISSNDEYNDDESAWEDNIYAARFKD